MSFDTLSDIIDKIDLVSLNEHTPLKNLTAITLMEWANLYNVSLHYSDIELNKVVEFIQDYYEER